MNSSDMEQISFYLHTHPLIHKKAHKQKVFNLQPLRDLAHHLQVSVVRIHSGILEKTSKFLFWE